MNKNIFGGIALNPYAPSGLLSNVISADAYWQQDTTCIGQIQNKLGKVIETPATHTIDDKIGLLRTTNFISLK